MSEQLSLILTGEHQNKDAKTKTLASVPEENFEGRRLLSVNPNQRSEVWRLVKLNLTGY